MRNRVIIKRLVSITGHEVKSCDRTEILCGPRGSGREISVTGPFSVPFWREEYLFGFSLLFL